MENNGLWDEEKEKNAQEVIKKEVLRAFNRAEREKRNSIYEMMTDTYEELTEEQMSQLRELKDIVERYPQEYDVDGFEEGAEGILPPSMREKKS